MALSPKEVHELKSFATEIRLNTLETLNHLGFGHSLFAGLSVL